MIKYLLLVVNCLSLSLFNMDENSSALVDNLYDRNDTTIVGKLIDADSIYVRMISTHFGTEYYYGVHHLKIACMDIRQRFQYNLAEVE